MDEMLDSLVMMSSQGQAQLAGVFVPPSLLDEVRDLAVAAMSEVFSQILERTATELLDLAGRNPSHVMYCLYMDTRDQAQSQRETLVSTFRRQLFEHFNEARRRGHLSSKQHPSLDLSELSLVEPEELEMSLASTTISHALRVACQEELTGLDRRMGMLLDDPDLRFGPNPLAPEVIGDTMIDAIKVLPTGNKVKLMLVTRVNAHLSTKIKGVYADINRLLVGRGILPTIRPEVRRAQGAPASAPASTPVGNAGENTDAQSAKPQQDMFVMLQQLMSMGRIGEGPGGPGGPHLPPLPPLPGAGMIEAANEGEVDSELLVQRLTQIQQGKIGNLPGTGLDPTVLANGQVNVLRAIKNTGAAGNMGHMDAMTLDIVALMFDYILDDPRLADGMKALIGRLQIPVLKVAMLDKAFFSQKAHPARRLLDTLADAALGWNEQEGHDSAFYKTIDTLIQRVLNEYEDKVEVFSQVLENLLDYLAEEKRLADERACQSAQILQSNEQAALAHTLSLEAVQARMLDNEVPEFIQAFLVDTWTNHLAALYLQEGHQSEQWNRALATTEDLLWSLAPKSTKEEKHKLVDLLPKLLKQLDAGIQAVALPREERDRFFSNLVKYHADAVKADLRNRDTSKPSRVVRMPLKPVKPSVTFAFDSPVLRDIPAPTGKVEPDPQILREISTPADRPGEMEEIVIGDVVGQDRLTLETGTEEQFEKQVERLKRGTWLEFILEDGTSLRAKLAWVSPLRGTYLFTNRLGERAVSINAAGLMEKLKAGTAKIVDNVALIDRAVSSLFERLQKSA